MLTRACPPPAPAALPTQHLASAAALLAMDRKSSVSKVVAETLRLRVQSIDVRIAAADLTFTASPAPAPAPPSTTAIAFSTFFAPAPAPPSTTAGVSGTAVSGAVGAAAGAEAASRTIKVAKGRILAVCPFESHHDAALFADAERFDPDRPALLLGDGTAVVQGVSGERGRGGQACHVSAAGGQG